VACVQLQIDSANLPIRSILLFAFFVDQKFRSSPIRLRYFAMPQNEFHPRIASSKFPFSGHLVEGDVAINQQRNWYLSLRCICF
jgi:hypothetical protein